jgi:hypothetical protein
MRFGIVSLITLTISIQFFFSTSVKCQSIDQVKIKLELKGESLIKAFQKIEAQSPFHFIFSNSELNNISKLYFTLIKQYV